MTEEKANPKPPANKAEVNRRWVEAKKAALDAYAEQVEREGLPLAKYRTF
jgi:antitoxin CcdA